MAEPAPRGPVRIERFGEAALLVVLGDRVDAAINDRVHRLAARMSVRAAHIGGLGPPIPAYASVLLPFDPLVLEEAAVRDMIAVALDAAGGPSMTPDRARVISVPVRYGGPDGPDLAGVAARTGRSEADVVRLHAAVEYRVFCMGFVPGFPYLGLVPKELALPRRATPRLHVPAGSVAIAGRQTGIYPADTPGGWHLIGRTDLPAWDPRREPPALLEPGARVRFVPV
jgi:KipI family sensor histidine kinase inhibitor